MPTASRVPSSPATPKGYVQLTAGKAQLDRLTGSARLRRLLGGGAFKRRAFYVVLAVVALYVLWRLFLVAVGVTTNVMWFDSVHAGVVYRRMIEAQIGMFAIFGVVAGVIGGVTLQLVRRIHPLFLSPDDDTFRWAFRRYERRLSWLLVLLAVVVPGYLVGQSARRGWQTYLLWRHATPFHQSDPVFHRDISFYVEVYPFHRLVVSLLLQSLTYALWILVIAGYWYGVWRLRRGNRKIAKGFTALASIVLAGYFVLRALNYWLSRYALTTSPRGPVTGAGYTDTHAGLPSAYVLIALALLAAITLVVNVVRFQRVRVFVATVVVFLVAAPLIGSAWPALVYRYQEAPSAAKVDLTEIARNQKATLAAFGLDGNVNTVSYHQPSTGDDPTTLVRTLNHTAQTPVIDPNQLSPTFNVQQQLQAYYGFKSTLDLSHYDVDGRSQDVALAVRELRAAGIPQQSWVNSHLVFTHGYGVAAAHTTRVDPSTQSPDYLTTSAKGQIPVTRPQVYFGQGFPSSSYAIVGEPAHSNRNLEFDHPGSGGSSPVHTTYRADGGIPVGSAWRRLLFAIRLHSTNVFFSSELNGASQLLMTRNPRARVAQVAPWLTLDGDVYPAVVDGHIKWIVDGYTTSSNYPEAQQVNLRSATKTSLNANGASVSQASTQVNYLHNSVKAVVDAYTGRVSLYEWNQKAQPDPLLKAWESVYPGLVEPQSHIPSALLSQLRYPTDLFTTQRYLLARYHVTGAANFYSGNDFWSVPTDPTTSASINSSGSNSSAPLPARYMSMSSDGYGAQHYSLSSPMGTLNGRQLAAFVYVNSTPGPDCGKFTVLRFPPDSGSEAPSQVQNDIESDTTITEALTLQRGGNSKVVLGGLEAIPVAGHILYVEPVYTQSSSSNSFPILRHVIALYANGDPSFEDTLQGAVKQAFVLAARHG